MTKLIIAGGRKFRDYDLLESSVIGLAGKHNLKTIVIRYDNAGKVQAG